MAVASFALAGCQQVVDLGEDGGASRITIESRLQVGAAVEVSMRVTDSFGATASSSALAETTGVIDGSDGTSGTLYLHDINEDVAKLRLDTLSIAEGVTYTLRLEAPGFAPITSRTTVPRRVVLGAPPERPSGEQVGPRDSNFVRARLYFEDIPEEESYYHVLVTVVDALGDGREAPVAVDLKTDAGTLTDLVSGGATGTPFWLFDDRAFAGGVFDAELLVDAQQVAALAAPEAIVEVRTVSRSYYSYARAELAQGVPVSAAAAVARDNVVGGGGLFGSYTTSVLRQRLR